LAADDFASTSAPRFPPLQRRPDHLADGEGCQRPDGDPHSSSTSGWIRRAQEDHQASGQEVSSSPVSSLR